MDYLTIKLFHFAGIMLLFLGLGGMLFASRVGLGPNQRKIRRAAAILHGIGLITIIVTGIAMLSGLGLPHGDPPNWIKVKFLIWLLLGGSISLAARLSRLMWVWIPAWILLGMAAGYLALYKPF
ncbi:MAG: hypothetical protein LV479_02850 [Methylacidiphilales bacterium]|nr:hypothetical protein [Candidatus Methylacidiphilales bacterium]